MVSFETLNIQDKESVWNLTKAIDKSNGYIFTNIDFQKSKINPLLMSSGEAQYQYYKTGVVQEKYIDNDDEEEKEEQKK